MKSRSVAPVVLALSTFLFAWAGGFPQGTRAEEVSSSQVRRLFKNPPTAYSTGPLWVWNDLLTEEEIVSTLHDLASQSVKQVWVHPRPGLMTPYLSEDWFHLWQVALREARKLDMNVWIYDENSYPSGFAGGWVPEVMPESRGRGLSFRETSTAPKLSPETIGVYRIENDTGENLTAELRGKGTLPDGRYLVASEVRAENSPWHADRCYVNLLSPGVTEKFLDLTLEAYRRAVGQEFGKRVPGVFTDEPNIHPAGQFPWSEVLLPEFRQRWGYDLLDCLPSLRQPIGDWRKVRHNYFQVLNEQFIEHWSRPYHDYCEKHHLEWTGHYWDHEWPNCIGVPDNMAMYAWHQRPAIDCLMNQYAEHTHAQFGNARMVKELSSVANQLGNQRTLCETYGAGGWDLRFEDMKRIGDWLEVLGVNTINQHLSYVTIRGARKRDHPQSFSYHEPWWEAYHVSARYFARLSAALSQGQQINPILVLEPTTTAWMYQGDEAHLQELGNAFFKLVMALEAAQVEYDLGCEDVIARHGSISGNQLKIGNRSYAQVVLPPLTENLNRKTKELLDQVTVIRPGGGPARIDGRIASGANTPPPGDAATNVADWIQQVVANLRAQPNADGFRIERDAGDQGILFHHRRELNDGQLLFLVNTSAEHPAAGTLFSNLKGIEHWDLYSGEIKPFPTVPGAAGVSARFELRPCGSLLLFLSQRPVASDGRHLIVRTIEPRGEIKVDRLQPNVLTLDYVTITAGGETRTNIYAYEANQFAWKANGQPRDPWDSGVQFKDEFISHKFPASSGFEAAYRFVIKGAVPSDLQIVTERPDLYQITCNGRPVQAKPEGWWLDKAFGRIPIAPNACSGENVVVLKAAPFTMFHELEAAYLLGSFSLAPAASGFVVAEDHPLQIAGQAGWNAQGQPFYAAGVRYREEFDLKTSASQYSVALVSWFGSVAKVLVNDQPAGYIDAPPYECDVTRQLRKGMNKIDVVVVGTLKNTLGPHHGNPPLGTAWPGSFHKAPAFGPPPGQEYSTVAYGLFEPFVLKATSAE